MILSPSTFNRQLRQMGQAVAWRRATSCPCRSATSGAARPGCPICHGRGVSWGSPIPAWTGVASQRVAREWAAFGQWEGGDELLTIPGDSPLYAAGENDRVLMTQSTEAFQVVQTRGAAGETLPPAPATFDQVTWLSPDGTTLTYGGLPSTDGNGVPTWAPSVPAPPVGTQYSARGRRSPEYYVFATLVQDRAHFGGLPLPRRVQVRKFDLFGRDGA